MKYKVVIGDFIEDPTVECEVLGENFEVVALKKDNEKDFIPHLADVDAVMLWHEFPIGKDALDAMAKCKIISRMGVGFDNVDIDYAKEKGIAVCNVPDYGTDVVADHAMMFMLALCRNLSLYNEAYRKSPGNWDPFLVDTSVRLKNKKLGLIGMGRIGTAVALRAKAFGLDIQFYDPYVSDGYDKAIGAKRVELGELLESSDIISLHVPLTSETKNMINKNTFAKMKKGVLLVNTARGGVLDFDALYDAINSGIVGGCGLDVTHPEPPSDDSALIKAWRDKDGEIAHKVLLTPHSAFYTEESLLELRQKGAQRIKDYFEKGIITNQVNEC
jgi:C-terminal binding protein